ncbi:MATE family efflux transporter [Butyrivibrio sp. NC2002]|jgi:putative MATE family efflux protein|uniref:MATE family efflux transporter n=1 Tax=Butyrivibrio sp. NC2002 TaxID=1410610 RepID=UPI00055F37C4|nr:MATE family efflux transporter [Butyrivibrio sp. NC2002]
MEKLFSDKEFYNKLIRLTLPIAFQSLMLAAVAAADAIMLGRIEQDQMAAVSLATQIQFVQNMILGAATAAGAILGAQYYGKKDNDSINKVFAIMVRIVGIFSLITAAGCLLIPEHLMHIFASDKTLIAIGASYLRIAAWSYFLTGISESYLVVMRVTNHVNRSALISTGVVVLNIILNSIFIFGMFGLPAMGANGAALATLISRIVEIIWAVSSAHQKGFLHPNYSYIFKFFKGLEKDFIKVALPLLGGGLFWGVGFTSYTAIMGHLGSDAAAANSVAAVVRDLFCCMCNGISSAGGIMVGNELGAGRLDKGKTYGIRLAKISYIIGFLCTGLVLLVTAPVVSFMKLTPVARQYLVGMMIVMAVYMIGRCVNTIIINGIFGAGGDTLFDVYSLAVTMWCLAIPTALLGAFVFHWPVVLVYACTCLDEVGKIPWVMYHFKKYKWVKDLTRERA